MRLNLALQAYAMPCWWSTTGFLGMGQGILTLSALKRSLDDPRQPLWVGVGCRMPPRGSKESLLGVQVARNASIARPEPMQQIFETS